MQCEYVVRFAPVWEIYTSKMFPPISRRTGFLDEILARLTTPAPTITHRICKLSTIESAKTCTGLVQKSSSLPASDIY